MINGIFTVSLCIFRRRIFCALIAFIAVVFGNNAENQRQNGTTVDVECAPLTLNTSECFIAKPFRYEYGDQLQFNEMNASQANQIYEFSVSYEARLDTIPSSIWSRFPNIEQLKLNGVSIHLLHPSDFENAWNLYNLTLGYNNLTFIPSMLFSRATKLMEINLEANHIQRLEDYAFNGLFQLYYLSLSRNHIVTLTADVFSGAPHLADLRLDNNLIATLEPGVFDLPDLMFLHLSNNQLKTLPDDCFAKTQLIGLDLQSNDLTHVGNATYTPYTLRALILSYNDKISDLNVTRVRDDLKYLVTFKYDHSLTTLS